MIVLTERSDKRDSVIEKHRHSVRQGSCKDKELFETSKKGQENMDPFEVLRDYFCNQELKPNEKSKNSKPAEASSVNHQMV